MSNLVTRIAVFLSIALMMILFLPLGGCSGGSGKNGSQLQTPTAAAAAATGLGTYRIVVKWPAKSRATVLEQALSIVFTITPATGPPQTQTLNQSDTADSVEFTNLAVGEATVVGTAFTGENGTGTAVGKGTSVVVIVAGQTSEKNLVFLPVGSNPPAETGGLIIYPVDSIDGPPVVEPPIVDPPIVDPPVVDPPVVDPPVVDPPVVDPPVVTPPSGPKQTLLRISFSPAQQRYVRGKPITIKVEQSSPDHIKAVGQSLRFVEHWEVENTHEKKSRVLGTGVTDDTGTARLYYIVPEDKLKDHVNIHVVFDGSAEWQAHEDSRDLSIGTL